MAGKLGLEKGHYPLMLIFSRSLMNTCFCLHCMMQHAQGSS